MLASAVLAFYIPFEFLLLSYAFLGPLHYITEISWLHDKQYFLKGKLDPFLLIVPALLIMFYVGADFFREDSGVALLIGVTFGMAAAFTFLDDNRLKLISTLATILLVYLLSQHSRFFVFLILLIPSVIHIFVFTGAFILFGALKSRSFSGHLSFVVFLLCPLLFLIYQPSAAGYTGVSSFVSDNIHPFLQISRELGALLGVKENWNSTVSIIRFLAFAYTYHYLNWFSKTQIIRWHNVTTSRLTLVFVSYLCFISIYAYDYALGFVAASFLSLAHVFLEFPLNHRSFVGIRQELLKRM